MTIMLLGDILKINRSFILDVSRLLILFDTYSQKRVGNIVGITKVVKLDFFVRYPTVLEKALQSKKQIIRFIDVKTYERNLVESTMIRYKFGPWDERYWSILSTMESLDLIQISKIDGKINFKITQTGKNIVELLKDFNTFDDYFKRCQTVTTNFGGLSIKNLIKKIYKLRPELKTMKFGEEIKP